MLHETGRIDAILFDVDGTLIDTYRLYVEAYRRALHPYLDELPSEEEVAARPPSSELRFLTDWVGEERARECHAEMCRHYAALHPTHFDGMYDGVREMLAALRSAGIPLGVVTGKGRNAWATTLQHLELGPFEVVVTEDDVEHPKPDPAGLLTAAEALGREPRVIAYVGDSLSDMQAGRAAGMAIGAALWPKTAPGERETFVRALDPYVPEWRFDRPADLVRAFAPWC